jgi:hypothetical protein
MNSKRNIPKNIPWYSWDIFWLWVQVRTLYENVKEKIKNLITK